MDRGTRPVRWEQPPRLGPAHRPPLLSGKVAQRSSASSRLQSPWAVGGGWAAEGTGPWDWAEWFCGLGWEQN